MELTMNSVNQIPKGNIIYAQNKQVESICLIVKGRVLVYNSGMKIVFGPGSFIGISDLVAGRYAATCFSAEDVTVYSFPTKRVEDIEKILEARAEYRGSMVSALSRNIVELYRIQTQLKQGAETLYTFLEETYAVYKETCKKSNIAVVSIPELEDLKKYEEEDSEAVEENKNVLYYLECATLPQEVQKAYYSHGSEIANRHVEEQMKMINSYHQQCMDLSNYIHTIFQGLCSEKEECLYKGMAKLILELRKLKVSAKSCMEIMEKIKEQILKMEALMVAHTGKKLSVDKNKLEQIFNLITSDVIEEEEVSTETAVKYAGRDTDAIEAELENSLGKLLAYSELSKEKCDEFEGYILAFMAMRDKNDVEDDARRLRKKIANLFYEFYEAIFLKNYKEKSGGRLIDLFLQYGFVDERLLTKEQLLELYCLEDDNDGDGPCRVYNIKQWLTAVFEGEKEPSKSEFDMDYTEYVRDMKKSGQIREEQMPEILRDPLRKLQYEIKNMFCYNNRIASGQMSVFVPILYKELFLGHLDKSFVSTDKVNAYIKKVLSIDYSLFYRESMYSNAEKGIDKVYIMMEVFPDIILLPVWGSNGVMWQEITGKRRTTQGRMLFPIFNETDMEEAIIKTCGRFRWELCRTMQGTAWNDVKYKSLTSEYVDYIQFYKKNRLLSEEKRERLKSQIQKGRGNTREIFVIDYVIWIKNESMGSMRLNRVVREVMASYCPFVKEIRQRIEAQPLFEEAMTKFKRERLKKVRELDLRYRTMENNKIELTKELLDTMAYYRDM